MSLKVRPAPPKLNSANLGLRDAVSSSDHNQGLPTGRTNLMYISFIQLLAQLFAARGHSPAFKAMQYVALRRHVFEIVNIVVGSVQVFVIDLQSLWARAKKGMRDQGGNFSRLSRSPHAELKDTVPIGIGRRSQNPPTPRTCARSISPDAPPARDAVPTDVTGNWLPEFIHIGNTIVRKERV